MFHPDRKWIHRLSERLSSLGIFGTWLWASLKPLDTIGLWCSRSFRGPSIRPPVRRETPVYRIAFPVWKLFFSSMSISATGREIISESCQIKLKSDCIYQFPIDLQPNGIPLVSDQSKNVKYNLIWVRFDATPETFLLRASLEYATEAFKDGDKLAHMIPSMRVYIYMLYIYI